MKQFFQQFGRAQFGRSKADGDSHDRPAFRWIVEGRLAVGPIPDITLHGQLLAAGFKSVLTLCAETERQLPIEVPQTFNWQRLVLPDSHYQDQLQPEQLAEAVAFVHQAISQNQGPVYVHCLAGMERSPSVCVSYLCLHQGMEVWEALNWVKQRNSRTSINSNQVQVIQALVRQQA
jgi:atypical dual specificity phosphatase